MIDSRALDIWHVLMSCLLAVFFCFFAEKSKDLNKVKEDVAQSTIQLEKIKKVCMKPS